MKSVSPIVDTPGTEGVAAVPLQALTAVDGSPDAGSKGVVVSAPETPKAMPEAEVGVADRVTVIVSDERAVAAIPYHSMLVDS